MTDVKAVQYKKKIAQLLCFGGRDLFFFVQLERHETIYLKLLEGLEVVDNRNVSPGCATCIGFQFPVAHRG